MRTLRLLFSLVAVALTSYAPRVSAQAVTPPPAESHQFDFWLGEWKVTVPSGKPAGTSRIESIASGYGILENWTGAGGSVGKSLNTWNATKKQWQQFWVGNDGTVLELAGGLDAQGRMVLSSDHVVNGQRMIDRITWTPDPDGSVRQLWEQSTDGGKTWQVAFDGHYAKADDARKMAMRCDGGGGDGVRSPCFMFW